MKNRKKKKTNKKTAHFHMLTKKMELCCGKIETFEMLCLFWRNM